MALSFGPAIAEDELGVMDPLPNRTDVEVTDEAWYDDASELPDPGVLEPLFMDAFGLRYGDQYIDRSVSPSLLRVNVVAGNTSDRERVEEIVGGNTRVAMATVEFGAIELSVIRDQITAIVANHLDRYETAVNAILNRVVIKLPSLPPTLVPEIVFEGIPPRSFEIRTGWQGVETAHSSQAAYPPFEGALRVTIGTASSSSGGACTSWFPTKASSGTPVGIVAGHCARGTDQYAWIGGARVGSIGANSYFGTTNSDSASFFVQASAQTSRIFVGANTHRSVRCCAMSGSTIKMGTRLCFWGSASHTCGDVNLTDATVGPDDRGVTHRHLFGIDGDAIGGDSGSPVYQIRSNDGSVMPVGIVSLRDDNTGDMMFHFQTYVRSDQAVEFNWAP